MHPAAAMGPGHTGWRRTSARACPFLASLPFLAQYVDGESEATAPAPRSPAPEAQVLGHAPWCHAVAAQGQDLLIPLLRPNGRGAELVVPHGHGHRLFHGLNSASISGWKSRQSPVKVRARSSMVMNAAGFS